MAAATASPAMAATTSEPMVSARNGCTLKRVISTTISAMPTSAATTSRAPEAGGAVEAWASRTGSTVAVKAGLLAGRGAAGRRTGVAAECDARRVDAQGLTDRGQA